MLMTIYATTNQHQVRSLPIGCLKISISINFPVARLFEIDFRRARIQCKKQQSSAKASVLHNFTDFTTVSRWNYNKYIGNSAIASVLVNENSRFKSRYSKKHAHKKMSGTYLTINIHSTSDNTWAGVWGFRPPAES